MIDFINSFIDSITLFNGVIGAGVFIGMLKILDSGDKSLGMFWIIGFSAVFALGAMALPYSGLSKVIMVSTLIAGLYLYEGFRYVFGLFIIANCTVWGVFLFAMLFGGFMGYNVLNIANELYLTDAYKWMWIILGMPMELLDQFFIWLSYTIHQEDLDAGRVTHQQVVQWMQ